jgi:hypothetical protein
MRPWNQPLRDVTSAILISTLSSLHPLTVSSILSQGERYNDRVISQEENYLEVGTAHDSRCRQH